MYGGLHEIQNFSSTGAHDIVTVNAPFLTLAIMEGRDYENCWISCTPMIYTFGIGLFWSHLKEQVRQCVLPEQSPLSLCPSV
uniref:Uncharacterized protein n=1 Tax=Anguilla anguilla TaxID=7936 RepID=A0A0E9WV60_ANGAN